MKANCVHCAGIANGTPQPCRRCGAVTECMYDVGSLAEQHEHYALCQGCWRDGAPPRRAAQTRKAAA